MELNTEAWNRWVQYRSAIKKPIKDASLEAMKLKLERMGNVEDQAKIVDQSIANQWQGLFELSKPKTDPHAPKVRSKEQQAAADATFAHSLTENERGWKKTLKADETFGKLLLAEALLARYSLEMEGAMRDDKMAWLKDQVAQLLRLADPRKVLNDLTTWRLVLRLFSFPGIHRLEQRAKEVA